MLKTTEAAKLAGISNATLHRARRKGKVAFDKDENGHYIFDPSELARAFTKTVDMTRLTGGEGGHVTRHDVSRQGGDTQHDSPAQANGETEALLREQVDLLKSERDDLRARLDRAEQKRDEAQTKLTALLTDQRPQEAQESRTVPRWWLVLGVVLVVGGVIAWVLTQLPMASAWGLLRLSARNHAKELSTAISTPVCGIFVEKRVKMQESSDRGPLFSAASQTCVCEVHQFDESDKIVNKQYVEGVVAS